MKVLGVAMALSKNDPPYHSKSAAQPDGWAPTYPSDDPPRREDGHPPLSFAHLPYKWVTGIITPLTGFFLLHLQLAGGHLEVITVFFIITSLEHLRSTGTGRGNRSATCLPGMRKPCVLDRGHPNVSKRYTPPKFNRESP